MRQPEPAEKQWQTLLALVLSALGIALSLVEAVSVMVVGVLPVDIDPVEYQRPCRWVIWHGRLFYPRFITAGFSAQSLPIGGKGCSEVAGYRSVRIG